MMSRKPLSRFLPTAAFLGLLLASPLPAFARGGLLKEPTLALPPDLAGREQIMKVIADPRFRFVGGVFLNAHSALRYEGGVEGVNDFVARLAACPDARVHVDFEDDEAGAAWTLSYDSSKAPHRFRVVVNVRRIDRAAVRTP